MNFPKTDLGTFEGERLAAAIEGFTVPERVPPRVPEHWRTSFSDAALRAAVHIGKPLSAELTLRPLGADGYVRLSLGALLFTADPADLTRCLSQHPREAVQFLLGRMDLSRQDVLALIDHDPAMRAPVRFRDHAAPDMLPDGVAPRHIVVSRLENTDVATSRASSPDAGQIWRRIQLVPWDNVDGSRIAVSNGSFVQDLAGLIAIIAFCAAVAFIAAGVALPRVPV